MTHRFSVGEAVGYNSITSSASGFEVVQLLPQEDFMTEPRYKIKARGEVFERVAWESELSLELEISTSTAETVKRRKNEPRLPRGGRALT